MRNIYRSLMRNVGHTQWFSDLGKDLVPLDRAVQRVSGGKLSLVGENTVTQLLLTTTGRKTGRDRKSVVYGTCVPVRVDPGGRRHIKKNKIKHSEQVDINTEKPE